MKVADDASAPADKNVETFKVLAKKACKLDEHLVNLLRIIYHIVDWCIMCINLQWAKNKN